VKRDSIYYQIFKRFPALIFELVDDRPEQAQNYRFESVEVKETSFRTLWSLFTSRGCNTQDYLLCRSSISER
jgi:predicted transposase YdaD